MHSHIGSPKSVIMSQYKWTQLDECAISLGEALVKILDQKVYRWLLESQSKVICHLSNLLNGDALIDINVDFVNSFRIVLLQSLICLATDSRVSNHWLHLSPVITHLEEVLTFGVQVLHDKDPKTHKAVSWCFARDNQVLATHHLCHLLDLVHWV